MTKARFMIVEDENVVSLDLRWILQNLGYSVPVVASSGEEALKKLERLVRPKTPDIVLMDIGLKEKMNGIDTAVYIRKQFNIPVIYITAYSDDENLELMKKTKPLGYIYKPFDERELSTTIGKALRKLSLMKNYRKKIKSLSELPI